MYEVKVNVYGGWAANMISLIPSKNHKITKINFQRPLIMNGIGLSAFDENHLQQFSQLGKTLQDRKTEELETQFTLFKSLLFNYIDTYRSQIESNGSLQSKIMQICQFLNIEPLQILNRDTDHDQFYYELSCKIIEFNNEEGNIKYGGLIPTLELLSELNSKLEGRNIITLDDLKTTIDIMTPLNSEIAIVKLNKQQYIKTFKLSLSTDNMQILQIANEIGCVSVSMIRDNLNWSVIKTKEVLKELVNSGYLWLDNGETNGESLYWDPGWINNLF
ncbi:hypothetical protein WICPIJ_001299 [Wickerhamomyces pijperi]|uniref:Vacuolar-sorting protein SNF8 n=1 Tax=Wickerhamomyces pijperi TaxID=599730 RepID=A0A9P8QDX5_WICPI|nr:hypothetical protein WICPIJ_001299 [Wickerhamomyces pijperi]